MALPVHDQLSALAAGHPGWGDHATGVIATGGDVKPAGGVLLSRVCRSADTMPEWTMRNPWLDLPPDEYLHPLDAPLLDTFDNDGSNRIRLDAPPSPYAGDPAKAVLYILLANPGFAVNKDGSEPDLDHFADPYYAQQLRKSLTFEADRPLFYLNPRLAFTGSYQWQAKRFRRLIETVGLDAVARKVMVLQFHPYRSVTYRRQKQILPSQEFTFHILRQALAQGKLIVVTRLRREWEEAVAELSDYPCIELANARSPYLTPTNMKVWSGATKSQFVADHGQAELEHRQTVIWNRIIAAVGD